MRLKDEQTTALKAWIDGKYKHTLLTFVLCYSLLLIIDYLVNDYDVDDKAWTICAYWANNILVGATEN